MRTRRIGKGLGTVALIVTLVIASISAVNTANAMSGNGFRALDNATAASFVIPGDMRLVRTISLPQYGLTYQRYQQYVGPADVLGGELTVYRNAAGVSTSVIGAHYPTIKPTNGVRLGRADAHAAAARDLGAQGKHTSTLMINPASGRYFFHVETSRLDSRWVHWIDAGDGAVLNKYNALESDRGIGVKGDIKDINGPDDLSPADDLSTLGVSTNNSSNWLLVSSDQRQQTFDAGNQTSSFKLASDNDNQWTRVANDRKSPGQSAMVDAQYYANVIDDYLLGQHGFDWKLCYPAGMQSVVHYGRDLNNAYWNGTQVVFGDGDGISFRQFSGGLEVVAHEYTHGITGCTSRLAYQGESGALNEAFSDIVGTSTEFFANEPTTSNCVRAADQATCADWSLGEDVSLAADSVPGLRNMADPEEDAGPDHYSERLLGSADNGGVHTNSAIVNHAYYLLVNGGLNASCASPSAHKAAHCFDDIDAQDNNLNVTGVGLSNAARIFFLAFIGLPSNASMCDARAATESAAATLFPAPAVTLENPDPAPSQQSVATTQAWQAVGLTDRTCSR